MKKSLYIYIIFYCIQIYSQSPEKFTYQSIVRGSDGAVLTSAVIGFRLTILQNSSTGSSVYSETHTGDTNQNGLVTLIIGDGTSSDNFSSIDWSTGQYFLKVEVDPLGGSNYLIEDTSQLLSVPYALYSGNSLKLTGNDYITLNNQELTIGQVDLMDDVTGTLPIVNGGTGSTSAPMISVITVEDAAAARKILELGTASIKNEIDFLLSSTTIITAEQATKLDGIAASANNYSLPDATASALGGIKVGTNLSIDGDGVLSSTNTTYSVGDGGLTENDFTDALKTKLDGAVLITTNQTVAGEKTFTSTITGISIDGSGDLTMGTVTMTGFSVDADGDVVAKSLDNSNGGITNTGSIAGATSIDGSGDLTMGTVTMTGFSVDADGDVVAKSLDTKDLSANGKVITPSGTTGNRTINSMAGSVNFLSSATTLTVTNNLVDANSVIMLTRGTAVSANRNMSVVPSSGQFVITLDATFGAETKVFFLVIN